MPLKIPWGQKWMFWTVEKSIFPILANFWVTKLRPHSGKMKKNIPKYLKQNLVIGSLLENGFGATLN